MKRSSKAQYDAAIDVLLQLRAAFPEVISRLNAYKRRPLKVGISQDIQDLLPEIDPVIIGIAMRIYCSSSGYLYCLVAGASRVDLTGACCGEVTADQSISAHNRLVGILRLHREKSVKAAKQEIEAPKDKPKPKPKLGLSGLKAAARARAVAHA